MNPNPGETRAIGRCADLGAAILNEMTPHLKALTEGFEAIAGAAVEASKAWVAFDKSIPPELRDRLQRREHRRLRYERRYARGRVHRCKE